MIRGNAELRDKLRLRADAAHERRQFLVAAELYEHVLRLGDPDDSLLILCGHMRKEGRDFANAEQHYLQCVKQRPNDSEVLIQLGHFYKVVGRYADSESYYQRAAIARPGWREALVELQRMRASPERKRQREWVTPNGLAAAPGAGEVAPRHGLVSTDLIAKTRDELFHDHREEFIIARNGNRQKTKWGEGATVRGVDSLRGYIRASVPYLYLEIFLDGRLIHKTELPVAPLQRERSNGGLRKYVYNAWIDFSDVPYGEHELLFRGVNLRGDAREGIDWRRERIIVAEPLPHDILASSPGAIPPLDPNSPLSVVDQINARPSVVYRPSTRSYPGGLRNVLVIRADQLGDMVVSVPALLRLRDILPDSNIVGLLGPGNAELAQTLGVFNEIIILDFPDDPVQRARVMEKSAQEALIRQLAPYKFDLAIDFSRFGHSYKLLPMTGAPITLSFHKDGYKSLELVAEARSPKGEPPLRHSAWVQTLAEALALWLNSGASITRRTDLNRDDLTQYGVGPTEDYVLIHSGSRLAFIRWPHYPALAAQILSLGHKVVYIADDDSQRASLPQDALASGQLVYMARKLPSDHFDALISFASLFVGNDSGPKHLASLRGVKVVSIHPGRSDWREWGQELTGVVIGRQVPCAGCQLQYESEECVQDVACVTRITVSEVFREVQTLLSEDIS